MLTSANANPYLKLLLNNTSTSLCDEVITRPEESYRLWRVVVCDLETSKEEAKIPLKGCEYKPTMCCDAERKKNTSTIRNVMASYLCVLHFVLS